MLVASRTVMRCVALAALVSACSSKDDASDGSSGGTTATACSTDTRKDVYTAGLAKQSAAYTVKILDSTPSPPTKGTNAMTLEVLDGAGQPVDGATLSVTPFMPDHGHGSAVVPAVAALGGGKYAVSKIYYPMPGLWRLTVTVQTPAVAPQEVAFSFCFDG